MPTIYKPKSNKHYSENKNNTEQYKQRQKIYKSKKWIDLRNAKLISTPVCEVCNENLAEDVHHIKSFMSTDDPLERLTLAYDPMNLMSICKKCHGKLHSNNNK